MDWMHFGIRFVLGLHVLAALISLISAVRDRLDSSESLKWGGIGFVTGLVGLISRAHVDRRHVNYARIVQDALLNLFLEAAVIFGMPLFFK